MELGDGRHLGYCTNVHPYASVDEMVASLTTHAAPLRERLGLAGPLGVGLWLPAPVARDVARDPAPLRARLEALGLYAFTVNAFPFGAFHGERVKDAVFRPAWNEPERLAYTLDAATALAGLLPPGLVGSVSTHTGAYKPWGPTANDPAGIAAGFLAAAEGLARLERASGRRIVLALEPEPLSFLETTAEVVDFFRLHLRPAGEAARRHLGVCFDACHQAVEYEQMSSALELLAAADIPIGKIQLSSAIRVARPEADRHLLRPLAEDRWFHQVVARGRDGRLVRHADLAPALDDPEAAAAAEWRVHYHVPLFAESLDEEGRLSTTRAELAELLALTRRSGVTTHLEIETYTFHALPAERLRHLGATTLLDCLELEFRWVLAQEAPS